MKAITMVDYQGPWGYIPGFLHTDDPRKAREQINENYISGWLPFEGFTLNRNSMMLSYPDDPPMRPIDSRTFRDETLYLYPHAWLLIMQKDGSWEIARID